MSMGVLQEKVEHCCPGPVAIQAMTVTRAATLLEFAVPQRHFGPMPALATVFSLPMPQNTYRLRRDAATKLRERAFGHASRSSVGQTRRAAAEAVKAEASSSSRDYPAELRKMLLNLFFSGALTADRFRTAQARPSPDQLQWPNTG